MNAKKTIVKQILKSYQSTPQKKIGEAFAPSNIALCKYWGKRNLELNLPVTSSLSISLANKGSIAEIAVTNANEHEIFIDNEHLPAECQYAQRLSSYLDLFKFSNNHYRLHLNFNIPIASGLASSACGFASIVKAVDDLYEWNLDNKSLSILARLGSGSACRSVYDGFVEWHHGKQSDGMDSYATLINDPWPQLYLGLCIVSKAKKAVSSREGMQRTVETSDLYCAWPEKTVQDLMELKTAIDKKDFELLGRTVESNAMTMHATMLASWPPLMYSQPKTVTIIQQIWALRQKGLSVYFTQDAGPNLKLLFLKSNLKEIQANFPEMELIKPFHEFQKMSEEKVVLVNQNDESIGTETKLKAHQLGKLHRAFSVFIFYSNDNELKLLLQQRHTDKYHSGGLWTNTCCSHPRPDEDIIAAGERRLQEEIGIAVTLTKAGNFQYQAKFENGLIEHEYDHVLVGMADSKTVEFNKKEISAIHWISISNLLDDLNKHPEKFTPWFKQALNIALTKLMKRV